MKLSGENFFCKLKRRALDGAFRAAGNAIRSAPVPDFRSLDGPVLAVFLEGLGDSLVFTPALRAIRKSRPQLEVDLLVNETSRDLFKSWFEKDRLVLWEEKTRSAARFPSLIRKLRKRKYSTVIVPGLLFRHIALAWMVGAPVRIGFDEGRRGFLLNKPIPLDRSRHRIHSYRKLVEAAGVDWDGDEMLIVPETADRDHVLTLLASLSLPAGRPVVAVHPCAAQQANRWPDSHYAELADRLVEVSGAAILFTGIRSDRETIEAIRNRMHHESRSAAGRTSINQLAALLGHCSLLICPDTGSMHLAGAVGIPTLSIMGGRNRGREWRPISGNVRTIRHDVACSPCYRSVCPLPLNRCMTEIPVEDVWTVAHSLVHGTALENHALSECVEIRSGSGT